ncbi:hypothetical protein [Dongia sp.]|uniref:hypothetical protein n=1 Tax=Dongia sp. TaxID=1977262 RepID=UPI0035B0001A
MSEEQGAKDWAAEEPSYSLADAAEITGLSRSTLERLLREGLPYIERADRDRRKEWKLCIGYIIAFRALQKRKEAYAKLRRQQGLPIDPYAPPPWDPLVEEMLDDMILQLRDFLAAIGPESNAKRRRAMIGNFLHVLGRFELLRGKEP